MTKEHAYAYEMGYQDGLKAAETDKEKLRKLVLDWVRLYRDHERMSFKDSLGTEVVLFQRMQELGVMDE